MKKGQREYSYSRKPVSKSDSEKKQTQPESRADRSPEIKQESKGLFEIIELVNSIPDESTIQGFQFKQVILAFEAKLTEISDRLDNRDQLRDLNSHLVQLQQLSPIAAEHSLAHNKSNNSLQPPNDTCSITSHEYKVSPPQRSQNKLSSVINPQKVPDFNRMDVLEKKLRVQDEKFTKLLKEMQESTTHSVFKLDKQIKSVLEGQSKKSDTTRMIDDLSDNQKAFVGHLHTQQSEFLYYILKISAFQQQISITQEECLIKINDLNHSVTGLTKQSETLEQTIIQIQSTFASLESDLFTILKSYKDMLTEVFKIDLLQQQIKRMQAIYEMT